MADAKLAEFRAKGCTCEFGCPQCGYSLASMGNCAAWSPCPVGRETKPGCPLHAPTHDRAVARGSEA